MERNRLDRMRPFLLIPALLALFEVQAQGLDPDQNPFWTRYTFVEDSAELVPLTGGYQVYHLRRGMWWNYQAPSPVVGRLPEQGMRLLPLFGPGYPAFLTTPARGNHLPEEKLVVIRDRDTMLVELTAYRSASELDVSARCERMQCTRRPPVVLPFRSGWYLPNGLPFGADRNESADIRTTALTTAFDRLWEQAVKIERIIPQLNNDTCVQDLFIPAGPDRPETTDGPRYSDVWLMRSPYCAMHMVRFPALGTSTAYFITFVPYLTEKSNAPVHFRSDAVVDVTDWPVGDHTMAVRWGDTGTTLTLKLR